MKEFGVGISLNEVTDSGFQSPKLMLMFENFTESLRKEIFKIVKVIAGKVVGGL